MAEEGKEAQIKLAAGGMLTCCPITSRSNISTWPILCIEDYSTHKKRVDGLFHELGFHQRRAYRMSVDQFTELHEQLLPELLKEYQ